MKGHQEMEGEVGLMEGSWAFRATPEKLKDPKQHRKRGSLLFGECG